MTTQHQKLLESKQAQVTILWRNNRLWNCFYKSFSFDTSKERDEFFDNTFNGCFQKNKSHNTVIYWERGLGVTSKKQFTVTLYFLHESPSTTKTDEHYDQ